MLGGNIGLEHRQREHRLVHPGSGPVHDGGSRNCWVMLSSGLSLEEAVLETEPDAGAG